MNDSAQQPATVLNSLDVLPLDRLIEIVRGADRDGDDAFDMRDPEYCIGGTVRRVLDFNPEADERYRYGDRNMMALQVLFGIPERETQNIVYPVTLKRYSLFDGYAATVDQAVKMLENYRDTGVVDWDKALAIPEAVPA